MASDIQNEGWGREGCSHTWQPQEHIKREDFKTKAGFW